MSVSNKKNDFMTRRLLLFLFIIVLSFSVLFIRLFKVMILDNNKYAILMNKLSYRNFFGNSTPRGRILDRNYNVIVDNKAVNTVVYKKEKNTSYKEMIDLAYIVSKHLSLPYKYVSDRSLREFYLYLHPKICDKYITSNERVLFERKKISFKALEKMKLDRISEDEINKLTDDDRRAAYIFYLMRRGYSYENKIIKSNVSDSEFAFFSENNNLLRGFYTVVDWDRIYPNGDLMRSILGSVSSINQGIPYELKNEFLEKGYSLNDRVGLSYLEKEYEPFLKGKKAKYKILNSNEIKLVSDGVRGNDIVLSIDINLQREVEKILIDELVKTKREPNTKYYNQSSVIINDPYTGEILAIASKRIVGNLIVDNISHMLMSPITPGSVVKGASILVGYNENAIKIGENLIDECIKISGAPKKCSYKTLGIINDITALAKSSNVYQFKTAIRVNGQEYRYGMKMNFNQDAFDKYRNMYKSFGLGSSTGIDLPLESIGYTSVDKNAGNLLDFVMGQYETYTPLQISQYINTIANGKYRMQLHLLKEVRKPSNCGVGDLIYKYNTRVLNSINTKEVYMNRMKNGFYAVMHSKGGYGKGYIDEKLDSAGKTGTSQSFIDTNLDGVIDTETITSSFVGFLPFNNPKISITVTSPNSSYPNSNSQYASLVTRRITRRVTDKYYEMYPF